MNGLIADIERRWSSAEVNATLHGDLHLKNFLVCDGHAELIDLDTLHAGDPLEDLGSFAASLIHRAALGEMEMRDADAAVGRFVETYSRLVPWEISRRNLAAHIACALVAERACRSITRCKGDVVEALLVKARATLSESASAHDTMARFRRIVRNRPGRILDVRYHTYRKPESLAKSSATVAWCVDRKILVERIGAHATSWTFPNDPALPWMATAMDAAAVRDHLPLTGVNHVDVEVLNYRPEDRVTARYRAATTAGLRTLYGKTYSDDRGLRVWERLRNLYSRGCVMPEPLGYSPAIRTVWQESFGGESLASLVGSPEEAALLRGAASRLRFLHESGIPCSPRLTLRERHVELAAKMAKLAAIAPAAERRIGGLVERLGRLIDTLPRVPERVVHGDFHLGQLMVENGEVALFDLDEIGSGDPVEDFGNLIADLHARGASDQAACRVSARIMEAYSAEADWTIPLQRLNWHAAAGLLTRAYRAMLQLRPDFDERVERYIRLAEELI